jgi:hypothetical protein
VQASGTPHVTAAASQVLDDFRKVAHRPQERAPVPKIRETAENNCEPVSDEWSGGPGNRWRCRLFIRGGQAVCRYWWRGCRHIHGELLVPGIKTAASAVREILQQAGIDPAPERTTAT